MKQCTACKVEKYADEFYVRTGRNTLRSECKDCTYARNRREPKNPGVRGVQPEPTGEYKHCAKCAQDIDTAFFHKCSQNSDGLHSYCKACRSESSITVEASWIRPNTPLLLESPSAEEKSALPEREPASLMG